MYKFNKDFISVYSNQRKENNMYNLTFVSVTYDETGKELTYGYFEAVYSLENPNENYTKENPPRGVLLDREKDFINMGTYNYGNSGISHTFKDVFPYNGFNGIGNVGEDVTLFFPNDWRGDDFKDDIEQTNKKIEEFMKELK